MTYPNEQSDRIYNKGMYKRIYKITNFSIGKVVYTLNIRNNFFSFITNVKRGFKLVMEMCNNKEK